MISESLFEKWKNKSSKDWLILLCHILGKASSRRVLLFARFFKSDKVELKIEILLYFGREAMKQKYSILKNDEENKLIIREYAELDKEILSLLCEEIYDNESIESAIAKGKETLISTLRTKALFPISIHAEKIAEAIINMYEHENDQSVELFFNDLDILAKDREAPVVEVEVENDPVEIDELLEGDVSDSDLDDNSEIKNITRPIKVIDEDPNNIEDE